MKKTKVMHLLQSNEYSGAENVVCEIIDMFREDYNYDMIYCSPDGHIKKILEKREVEYWPLKKMSVYEIWKVIKKYQPDIIHAHDATACVLATFFFHRVKIVAQIHGNHINMRSLSLKSFLVQLCSKVWNKIIWVSQSSYDDYYFKSKVKDKSVVLPNIISKESILSKIDLDRNDYQYDGIVLGRINAIKDPLRALKILKKVCQEKESAKFVFVGDGNLMTECKTFVKNNGLEKNIYFTGFMDNPVKLLKCCKLLLMTSVYEGTPMCAIEAMGTGVPIVSTPTDGIVELIEQNETGFYSNDNYELVQKILQILNDDKLQIYMSNNRLNRFDELMNVELYKNKIVEIYRI